MTLPLVFSADCKHIPSLMNPVCPIVGQSGFWIVKKMPSWMMGNLPRIGAEYVKVSAQVVRKFPLTLLQGRKGFGIDHHAIPID